MFPTIFSHGWSVTMLSSRGEMRGVSDHSLTVLSLLQLAMVKGRLWWQVRPAPAGESGFALGHCSTPASFRAGFSLTVNIGSVVVDRVQTCAVPRVPHPDRVIPRTCQIIRSNVSRATHCDAAHNLFLHRQKKYGNTEIWTRKGI